MVELYTKTVQSPVGPLLLTLDEDNRLNHLVFENKQSRGKISAEFTLIEDDTGFEGIAEQLESYFLGSLKKFNIKTRPAGTEFQKRVWAELEKIPYGSVISYGELASRVGDIKAVRAVGHANNQNPIAIVIPCHRVIGAKGDLIGFGGGLEKKEFLLSHEGAIPGSLF